MVTLDPRGLGEVPPLKVPLKKPAFCTKPQWLAPWPRVPGWGVPPACPPAHGLVGATWGPASDALRGGSLRGATRPACQPMDLWGWPVMHFEGCRGRTQRFRG